MSINSDANWKARYAEARAARDQARQRLADSRRAVLLAKRQVLEPATLQALFGHRLRTLPARVQAHDRVEREQAFVTSCEAYRNDTNPTPRTKHGTIDGLTWHVPDVSSTTRALPDGWLRKQLQFPYNTILQTRDVTVGGLMIDIGANVGRTAIPRVVLGDVTGVYCAEPDPTNYYCLRQNVLDNGLTGLVMPDQVAISNHDGVVGLRRALKYTGHRVHGASTADLIEVPACTLDTWVERHGINLDAVTFIKVDVEGYEQQVLDGASDVLARRYIAWQLEFWAPQLRLAGGSASQLATFLCRHFTHFIDLRRTAAGPRTSPIDKLHDTAAELERTDGKTDLVVFNAADTTGDPAFL